MAKFVQFAIAATEEALDDAAWRPSSDEQREATVNLSSRCQLFTAFFSLRFTDRIGCMYGFRYWQL